MTWMRHSLQQSVCEVMTEPSAVARRAGADDSAALLLGALGGERPLE